MALQANQKTILNAREYENRGISKFIALPYDILTFVLDYLRIQEIEGSVKLACRHLRNVCRSEPIWQSLCIKTGKIVRGEKLPTSEPGQTTITSYRDLYYSIPCVPNDFLSIKKALRCCPQKMKQNSITIMPGIYHQRFDLNTTSFKNNSSDSKTVIIRAAFPHLGAVLVHYESNADEFDSPIHDQSCINIYSESESGIWRNSRLAQGHVTIRLCYLQILHSSPGSDIWGGNCAVRVDGKNTMLSLECSSLQSDSGRGVVVTKGAQFIMKETIVHDCAATGLYIGDVGSHGCIQKCNIIRNGGGSRQRRSIRFSNESFNDESLAHDGEGNDLMLSNFDDDDDSSAVDSFADDLVPPGHSGMYVETGNATVEDTLLAANRLTGLSVVREGSVSLSNCDITVNGSVPITIEDAHDMHLENNERRIRGGVTDMGGNRYGDITPSQKRVNHCQYPFSSSLGGFVRPTPFQEAIANRITEKGLRRRVTGC